MFGIDRQLMLFNYYATLSGFTTKQSLYWYFISSFPKATDLSKVIDKNAGAERDRIAFAQSNTWREKEGRTDTQSSIPDNNAITPLAQKYSGYKYSVAPLKQTCETIMVFQKPYKTGSCLHDVLAMENGDDSITCGALDIDGNRVGLGDEKQPTGSGNKSNGIVDFHGENNNQGNITPESGRYPSQTFCDS